jgi:hypothetical protein
MLGKIPKQRRSHFHRATPLRALKGFGGLEVACWPLVPKFVGLNPAEAVRIFKGEKILNTPSFGVARKRSLNGVEVVISAKLRDNISRP